MVLSERERADIPPHPSKRWTLGLSFIVSLCLNHKMFEEALEDETKIRPRAARYMAMARFPDLAMDEN